MTPFSYFRLKDKKWCWRKELNPRPPDYKSDALPTELLQQKSLQGHSEISLFGTIANLQFLRFARLATVPIITINQGLSKNFKAS